MKVVTEASDAVDIMVSAAIQQHLVSTSKFMEIFWLIIVGSEVTNGLSDKKLKKLEKKFKVISQYLAKLEQRQNKQLF
jgi:hypothetical protein